LLKETHIRLADRVASKIGVGALTLEAAYLRGGSVAPDEWKDFPHHHGKETAIRDRVLRSRKDRLEGREKDACYQLGVAFHYLADRWTLTSGSDARHANWERLIERSGFVDDVRQVIRGVNMPEWDKDRYYSFLDDLNPEPAGEDETLKMASLSRPSGWSSPRIDLNMTYKICLGIARSVFSSITPPSEILKKIEKVGENLERTATKLFYFSWFVGFMIIAFGFSRLLSLNFGASIVLGLTIFLIEFFSLAMFPLQGFSRFKNVRRLCSTMSLWKFLTFLLPTFFIFLKIGFGIPWLPLFYPCFGFFIQWCLSLYLYYKPGADKMSTYVRWYKEPTPVITE